MSWLSRTVNKAKSIGRSIDPTYSRGVVGRYSAGIVRPVVATAAVGLTGGAVLLARPSLTSEATRGYAAGAAIGTGAALAGAGTSRTPTDRGQPTDRGGVEAFGGGAGGAEPPSDRTESTDRTGPTDRGGSPGFLARAMSFTSKPGTLAVAGGAVLVLVLLLVFLRRRRRG